MRSVLIAMFAVGCGSTGMGPVAPASASSAQTMDVATLGAERANGANARVIDVRTPREFASGHVPGAINVPLDELDARIAEVGGEGDEVVVICEVGGRSATAAKRLAAKGLKPIDVPGGTAAWRRAGLPLER